MGSLAYLFGAAPTMPISTAPKAGFYYQVKKGDTPYAVSKKAYQDEGLTTVKSGLMLMNNNAANSHIAKATTGWESYGVKGLQFNPKYAAGDADAAAGSGKEYPLVWVPPLDGKTPGEMTGGGGTGPKGDTGSQGIPGPMGPQGIPGERGPQGIPGAEPSDARLKLLISDFMDENPVSGKVSAAELAAAVASHLKANPVAQGPQGIPGERGPQGIPGAEPSDARLKSLISAFMDENPVSGNVTPADLAAAVSNYLKANPVAQGPQGIPGERGPQGIPGPAPTAAQLNTAVATYLAENPISSGGGGFDMDQARDFVDARIRVALRNLPKAETSGNVDQGLIWGALAAGVVGCFIFLGSKGIRRRKGGGPSLVMGKA